MEGHITKSTDNAVSTDAPRAQEGIAVARRHHYVPRCYLKGFSVPRKKGQQVVVFDRVSRRSFQTATTNVAVEMDFNRIDVDGHPPDAFEKGMAAFESEIGPALDRIMAARSIADANDRAYLFNLIGLLATRNPRHRERWRDFEERIVKRVMSLVTATPERWASQVTKAQEAGYISRDANTDFAMMRKLVAEDGYTIEVPTERHIMLEMHAFEGILPYIFNRLTVSQISRS